MRALRWIVVTAVLLAVLAAAAWTQRATLRRAWSERAQVQGHALQAAGQADEARRVLLESLRRDRRNAGAHAALASLELSAGRIEHAFLHAQTAIELDPGNADAWLHLARAWEASGLSRSAENAATRATELRDDMAARRLRAGIRERLQRHLAATLDARAVLSASPGDASMKELLQRVSLAAEPQPPAAPPARENFWPGRLALAVRELQARLTQRDAAGALALARQAEAEYPATMIGPWLAGVAHFAQRDLPQAEQSLRQALAAAPRSSRVATQLAGVWAHQSGADAAGAQLVQMAEDDPGFVVPLDIAATAYLEARKPALAEQALRRGYVLAPDVATTYLQLASFHRQLDHGAEALAVIADGLQRLPNDAALLLRRAQLLAASGAGNEAVIAFEDFVARHPDSDEARAGLVKALLSRGDEAALRRATEVADALAQDSPEDPAALDAIGWQRARTQHARAAIPWLQAAITADPTDAAMHFHLAFALDATGDRTHAREQIALALQDGATFPERVEAQRLANRLR